MSLFRIAASIAAATLAATMLTPSVAYANSADAAHSAVSLSPAVTSAPYLDLDGSTLVFDGTEAARMGLDAALTEQLEIGVAEFNALGGHVREAALVEAAQVREQLTSSRSGDALNSGADWQRCVRAIAVASGAALWFVMMLMASGGVALAQVVLGIAGGAALIACYDDEGTPIA